MVREKGFHLDVEDYLAGVLIMASELVSLLLVAMVFHQQYAKARTMIVPQSTIPINKEAHIRAPVSWRSFRAPIHCAVLCCSRLKLTVMKETW